MPRAGKTPKPDPNAVYVAWTSLAADGVAGVIRQGERLRSSDAAVQACPWAFVLDGTPESEWPTPAGQLVERHERENPPPECDVTVHSTPRPFEPPDLVTLNRKLKVFVRALGRVVEFEPGTRFARAEPFVAALPAAFDQDKSQPTRGLRRRGV